MKIIAILILLYNLPILFSIVGEIYQEALVEFLRSVLGGNKISKVGTKSGQYTSI